MVRRGQRSDQIADNTSTVGGAGGGWFLSLMRQVADGTPGGWAGVAIKYGPAWLLVGWLMSFLLGGFATNLGAIASDAKAIRGEHMEMGIYLRGICMGVNREETWRCQSPR